MLGFAVKFKSPNELYPFLDYWLQNFREDWWWFWVTGEHPGHAWRKVLYVFGSHRALQSMHDVISIYFHDPMANYGPRSLLWFLDPNTPSQSRIRFFWYRFSPEPGQLPLFRQVPPSGWTDANGRSYIIPPPAFPYNPRWQYHYHRVMRRQVIQNYPLDMTAIRKALWKVRFAYIDWLDAGCPRQIRLPVLRNGKGARNTPGENLIPRRQYQFHRRYRRYRV